MTSKDTPNTTEQIQICSFTELCQRQWLDAEFITKCVEFGITEIEEEDHKNAQTDWTFSSISVQRIEKARRLYIDLEINISDLALVMDLLDEVGNLRSEVNSLRRRLQHWEPA